MPETIRSPRQQYLVERISRARKAAGLTQAEVASRLGRHQPFVANVESGQRRVDLIELIDLADVILLDLHQLTEEIRKMPHTDRKRAGSRR